MTNPTNDRRGGIGGASTPQTSGSDRGSPGGTGNDTARVAQALNALASCVESLVNESKPGNAKPRQELTEAKRLIGELRDGGSRSQQGSESRGDRGAGGEDEEGRRMQGSSGSTGSPNRQGDRQTAGRGSSSGSNTTGQMPRIESDDEDGDSPVRRP